MRQPSASDARRAQTDLFIVVCELLDMRKAWRSFLSGMQQAVDVKQVHTREIHIEPEVTVSISRGAQIYRGQQKWGGHLKECMRPSIWRCAWMAGTHVVPPPLSCPTTCASATSCSTTEERVGPAEALLPSSPKALAIDCRVSGAMAPLMHPLTRACSPPTTHAFKPWPRGFVLFERLPV